MEVSLVTVSCPSPRTAALPPCLPTDIKDLLKKDIRFLDGRGFWMWEAFWVKGGFLGKRRLSG
jgi:hypothetical protein